MPDEVTADVKELLRTSLTGFAASKGAGDDAALRLTPQRLHAVQEALAVGDGARDALLIVLAYRLVLGRPIDPRYRIPGDRSVSDYLGRNLLPDLGIAGVKSALEGRSFSHGYLSTEVRRSVLRDTAPIVSDPDVPDEQIEAMFQALARGIAATARRFEPLPALDLDTMTFPKTLALIESLLAPRTGLSSTGSGTGGAHEQFLVAALLQAVADDGGLPLRVLTKSLNASDRSAAAAGDIDVVLGQARLVEVYEVSARPWRQKVRGAVEALNHYRELERVHIIADSRDCDAAALQAELALLGRPDADVTVNSAQAICRELLARCSRRGRARAIRYFHGHLRSLQPDMALVDALVTEVRRLGLCEQ
jgi:hypothetical protein